MFQESLSALFRRKTVCSLSLMAVLTMIFSACGGGSTNTPVVNTRAPAPTFTPASDEQGIQIDPNAAAATKAALATAAAPANEGEAAAPIAVGNAGEEAPADSPQQEPQGEADEPEPTATPEPQNPEAVVQINLMNVRGGPGINYNILGGANQGERFPITGKDPTGAWWEVDYNGQRGWLFGELVEVSNTEAVAVAANIPPTPIPPPPTNTPPPPPPTAPPAPAAPPAPKYEFNIVVVSRCDPQAAGTWFEGKTYKNGNPVNGYKVVFSYAPDGPPATSPMISGPHTGYEGWDTGYYSHIISAPGNGPKAGTWYAWIVNDGGARISEIGSFTTDGDTNTCNQAVVDFDSR